MGIVEKTESRTTEPSRNGDEFGMVERDPQRTVTFVDCTTVVDNDVCHIPNAKFCPFNIRGNNMCSECMYWKARIRERRNNEKSMGT